MPRGKRSGRVFVGKLTVFAAALDGGFGWLVVVAAVNTVASLFYYLRWISPSAFIADPQPTGAVPVHIAHHEHRSQPALATSREGPATTTPPDQHPSSALAIGPTNIVHASAVASLLLGVGAGLWLLVAS